MSVRRSIAVRVASSTSSRRAAINGASVGWRCTTQKSGAAGSRISVRSRSSARASCASARMTASWLRATSASASTMSIGAIVPAATRARLLRSDSSASASDCRCTSRNATAKTGSHYAFRTLRSVEAIA